MYALHVLSICSVVWLQLQQLDLSDNYIDGTLPESWSTLHMVSMLCKQSWQPGFAIAFF